MFRELQKDMGSVQKNSILGILALVIILQYQEIQAENFNSVMALKKLLSSSGS